MPAALITLGGIGGTTSTSVLSAGALVRALGVAAVCPVPGALAALAALATLLTCEHQNPQLPRRKSPCEGPSCGRCGRRAWRPGRPHLFQGSGHKTLWHCVLFKQGLILKKTTLASWLSCPGPAQLPIAACKSKGPHESKCTGVPFPPLQGALLLSTGRPAVHRSGTLYGSKKREKARRAYV